MAKPQHNTFASDTLTPPRSITWRGLAGLYLLAVAYGSLLPFEFKSFSTGQPGNLSQNIMHWLTAPRWSIGPMDDLLFNALLYLPFGWLMTLGTRRFHHARKLRRLIPVIAVAAAVWLIECVQAHMSMRVASSTDWLLNTAGSAVGVTLAMGCNHYDAGLGNGLAGVVSIMQSGCRRLPRRMVLAVVIVGLLVQLGWHWHTAMPQLDRWADPSVERVNLMPLLMQFRMAYGAAIAALIRESLWYACMAGLFTLAWRQYHPRQAGWPVVAAVGLVTVSAELLKMMDPARYPDITDPLLACTVAALVVVVWNSMTVLPHRLSIQPASPQLQGSG